MPDGLRLSEKEFYETTISASQYLAGLESFLERLLAFRATDEDTARRWFLQALSALGYKDYATYEARIEQDTRIINPRLTAEEEAAGVIKPYMLMPGLQMPSSYALPYFEQVVAPIVYRKEAERQAVQFGYVDAEGTIVNEASYNTLIRNSVKDAEKFKYDFIQENLLHQKEEAERAGDNERIVAANENITRLNENIAKATEFMIGELGKEQVATHEEFQKQRREEAWAKQRAAPGGISGIEPTVVPSGEPAVREFLAGAPEGALGEFIKGELPGVLERFQREQAGARSAWWSALQQPEQPGYEESIRQASMDASRWATIRARGLRTGLREKLAELETAKGSPLAAQDMMPDEWAFYIAGQRMADASRRLQELRALTPEQAGGAFPAVTEEQREDPLKKYLAAYPWTQEFMKLSPSQRGFSPSRFSPSARWFV